MCIIYVCYHGAWTAAWSPRLKSCTSRPVLRKWSKSSTPLRHRSIHSSFAKQSTRCSYLQYLPAHTLSNAVDQRTSQLTDKDDNKVALIKINTPHPNDTTGLSATRFQGEASGDLLEQVIRLEGLRERLRVRVPGRECAASLGALIARVSTSHIEHDERRRHTAPFCWSMAPRSTKSTTVRLVPLPETMI
jgi:hypothetical protein